MFKNETSAQRFLVTFAFMSAILISFSQISLAADDDDSKKNNGQKVNCAKVADDDVKYHLKHGGKFKNDAEKNAYYQKAKRQCQMGGEAEGCEKDMKDLNESKSKFLAACGKSQMPSSGTAGNIGCSEAIRKCSQAEEVSSGLDEDSDVSYDVEQMREQLNYCPAKAGENLKEIKEELKAAKEEVDQLEDDLPQAQEKAMQAKTDGDKQMLDLQEQAQEQERQCRDGQIALEEKLSEEEKALYERAQEQYANIIQLNDQLAQAEHGIYQAQIDYQTKVYEQENNCHKYALDKINEKRIKISALVSSSQYNVGGFNQAVSRAGKTTRRVDQEEAEVHYRHCISDAPYKRAIATAASIRDAEEKRLTQEKAKLNNMLTQLQQQMGITQNNDVQAARNRNMRAVQNLISDCAQQRQMMQAKAGQAQMSAYQAVAAAQSEMQAKERRLQEAQTNYKNLRDVQRLKTRAGGSEKTTEGFYEALAAFAEFEGRAQSFRQTCCGDLSETKGTCSEVSRFMGVSDTFVASTDTPASPPAVEPSSTDPATPASASAETKTTKTPKREKASENIPVPKPRPVRKGPLPHPGQNRSGPQEQVR